MMPLMNNTMDVHRRNGDQSSDHLGVSACEYSSTKYSQEEWGLPVICVRDFYTKVDLYLAPSHDSVIFI